MKISEVKTAFKIADVEFVEGQTKLNFKYLNEIKDEHGKILDKKILTQNQKRQSRSSGRINAFKDIKN